MTIRDDGDIAKTLMSQTLTGFYGNNHLLAEMSTRVEPQRDNGCQAHRGQLG